MKANYVVCTQCGKETMKWFCSYVINKDLTPEQFYDAENNPEKIFDKIICPICGNKNKESETN